MTVSIRHGLSFSWNRLHDLASGSYRGRLPYNQSALRVILRMVILRMGAAALCYALLLFISTFTNRIKSAVCFSVLQSKFSQSMNYNIGD